MPSDRDDLFGNRVRAARAYKGLSQAQLAHEISLRYPEASASPSTVKRLEANDAAVRGSKREWTVWVADTTGAPDWFLEHGWTHARSSSKASYYRGEAFGASHFALELSDLEPEDWPDIDDLVARLAEFDIQLSDDDSLDDLRQRLCEKSEYLSRLAQATAGLEERAKYERWLIRNGFSEQAREELLGAPPNTMKEMSEQLERLGTLVLYTDDDGQVVPMELEEAEEVEVKPRSSAADAPPPAPPGDYGRELAEHLPTGKERERPQSPPARGARRRTGG